MNKRFLKGLIQYHFAIEVFQGCLKCIAKMFRGLSNFVFKKGEDDPRVFIGRSKDVSIVSKDI